MKTFNIAVIAGDGIGKEVVPEGIRVLEAAGKRFGFQFHWHGFDWSCETFVRTGKMMPPDGLQQLRPFDAIFLGAVGHPSVEAQAEEFRAARPDARVVVLKDTGHWAMYEAPEAVNQLLLSELV